MTEKTTMAIGANVAIGANAKVEIWRDAEWTILYVEDGSGAKTTISLSTDKALDLAMLLRGHAISAAFAPCALRP